MHGPIRVPLPDGSESRIFWATLPEGFYVSAYGEPPRLMIDRAWWAETPAAERRAILYPGPKPDRPHLRWSAQAPCDATPDRFAAHAAQLEVVFAAARALVDEEA